MRVRCSFCGAEYEAAVTQAALTLVGRCEQCGRERLESAEADPSRERPETRETEQPPRTA